MSDSPRFELAQQAPTSALLRSLLSSLGELLRPHEIFEARFAARLDPADALRLARSAHSRDIPVLLTAALHLAQDPERLARELLEYSLVGGSIEAFPEKLRSWMVDSPAGALVLLRSRTAPTRVGDGLLSARWAATLTEHHSPDALLDEAIAARDSSAIRVVVSHPEATSEHVLPFLLVVSAEQLLESLTLIALDRLGSAAPSRPELEVWAPELYLALTNPLLGRRDLVGVLARPGASSALAGPSDLAEFVGGAGCALQLRASVAALVEVAGEHSWFMPTAPLAAKVLHHMIEGRDLPSGFSAADAPALARITQPACALDAGEPALSEALVEAEIVAALLPWPPALDMLLSSRALSASACSLAWDALLGSLESICEREGLDVEQVRSDSELSMGDHRWFTWFFSRADNLALQPQAPREVLEQLPARSGRSSALARLLGEDEGAWAVASTLLEEGSSLRAGQLAAVARSASAASRAPRSE